MPGANRSGVMALKLPETASQTSMPTDSKWKLEADKVVRD